jgi:NTP pyrophosphatase (non-canonical NTP hydrolase)
MVKDRLEDQADHPRVHADDDAAVDVFSADMKRKLAANVHKKHWSEVSSSYLFRRMLEEMFELHEAMEIGTAGNVIDEAADVANFCMMIADCARHA